MSTKYLILNDGTKNKNIKIFISVNNIILLLTFFHSSINIWLTKKKVVIFQYKCCIQTKAMKSTQQEVESTSFA